jgi:hypothetical protein
MRWCSALCWQLSVRFVPARSPCVRSRIAQVPWFVCTVSSKRGVCGAVFGAFAMKSCKNAPVSLFVPVCLSHIHSTRTNEGMCIGSDSAHSRHTLPTRHWATYTWFCAYLDRNSLNRWRNVSVRFTRKWKRTTPSARSTVPSFLFSGYRGSFPGGEDVLLRFRTPMSGHEDTR